MADKYDDAEALEILIAARVIVAPDLRGQIQGASELLAALEAVLKKAGFRVARDAKARLPGAEALFVGDPVGNAGIYVMVDDDGYFRTKPQSSSQQAEPVPGIRFNPLSKIFEGTDPDPHSQARRAASKASCARCPCRPHRQGPQEVGSPFPNWASTWCAWHPASCATQLSSAHHRRAVP